MATCVSRWLFLCPEDRTQGTAQLVHFFARNGVFLYLYPMSAPLSVYSVLGEEKIQQLVDYFYEEVEGTPELRKLYPKDLEPARQRLFWFLLHVFGGPSTYLEKRGHPMLRRRHFQWVIDAAMRDRWLGCMGKAMKRLSLPPEIQDPMARYFDNAAHHLVNRHPTENG